MAILIKDMEMTESCFLCRFCRRQEYGEYVGEDTAWSCVASKKRITDGLGLKTTFKHPDCPLVEAAEVMDAVSRQDAIDIIRFECGEWTGLAKTIENKINELPSEQPERLTDDDFETIRIHLSAYKERLCNQCRWKEAEEYQRIIYRFMAFASAQPEIKPIEYRDCANAMLKMWMDNVVTDGEYNRIMDKLNEHEKKNGKDNG